jgi:hypothetical protein
MVCYRKPITKPVASGNKKLNQKKTPTSISLSGFKNVGKKKPRRAEALRGLHYRINNKATNTMPQTIA